MIKLSLLSHSNTAAENLVVSFGFFRMKTVTVFGIIPFRIVPFLSTLSTLSSSQYRDLSPLDYLIPPPASSHNSINPLRLVFVLILSFKEHASGVVIKRACSVTVAARRLARCSATGSVW